MSKRITATVVTPNSFFLGDLQVGAVVPVKRVVSRNGETYILTPAGDEYPAVFFDIVD